MTTPTSLVRTPATFSPRYHFHSDSPLVIATSPKVASTSIARAVRRAGWRSTEQKPWTRADKEVALVLRHPLERLVSAYYWFVRVNNVKPGTPGHTFGDIPFPAFVDYALKNPNQHWTPQTWQHADILHMPFTEYWPLELLDTLWPPELPDLDHAKKTDHKRWQQYFADEALEQRCLEYYYDDHTCYTAARLYHAI